MSQVEHTHGAVGADAGKYVPATAGATERYVVHLLVVSYELRLHMTLDKVNPS